MKVCNRSSFFNALLILSFFLIPVSVFISCDNFMNNQNVKNEILEQIPYNNAPECKVLFSIKSEQGKFLGNEEQTLKVGYETEIQFEIETKKFLFLGLEALSKDKATKLNDFVQFTKKGKIIYIFILNNLISFFSFVCSVDLLVQTNLFSKIAKFFSLGNNINNKKLLFEFFKINYQEKNDQKYKENNSIIFSNKEKIDKNKTLKKVRITFPKQSQENGINTFENKTNKFREVELIEKVEYKSIGIQTEEDIDGNNIQNNISVLGKEDISKNIMLFQNKSLINSFSTND